MPFTSIRALLPSAFAVGLAIASSPAAAQTPPPGPTPANPYYPGYPPPATNAQPGSPSALPPPARLRYAEGQPIPAGYHLESQPRKGLWLSGALVFGIPYVISVSVAGSSRHDGDRYLYIPAIGPFVDLATRGDDCPTDTGSCAEGASVERFWLTFDGLCQVGGATLFILGMAMPQKFLERDDAPISGQKSQPSFAWSVAPRTFGKRGMGLSFGGQF